MVKKQVAKAKAAQRGRERGVISGSAPPEREKVGRKKERGN